MTPEETRWLGEQVYELAETGNVEALRRFSFITFGNPYKKTA